MTPDFAVRGWCPGALRPMASGDGLVVRLRLPAGRLSSETAHAIADLSRRYGNGLIDLSARANLQLRGVRPEAHPPLIAALQALALLDPTPEAEARRNILVTPYIYSDDISVRIAADLAARLSAPDAPDLPGKFGFAVDCGGGRPVLGAAPADIRIEATPAGPICRAEGLDLGRPVSAETAAAAALDLARWFIAAGGVQGHRGRMAALIARGVLPPEEWRSAPAAPSRPVPPPGPCAEGFLIAPEFGRLSADALDALAALGPLRLTPWRMVLIAGARAIPDLGRALNERLIRDPADPRLKVSVCPGAPECPQARAATRDLARALAPMIPAGRGLHVSGCAKGCAHPAPEALTLTATAPDRFDLIAGGRAADPPIRCGLSPAALLADPRLLTHS